jgi:two-component system, cell cycle response regulator DivK
VPPATPSRSLRVLLVDDATDEREMYAEFLRLQGFCTLQAENAVDGFRLAAEVVPDIVVTDIRLLGHSDGLELTRQLKAATETARVPVVVLSGSVYPHDRQAAAEAGCDLFLAKPCLPDELVRVVAGAVVSSEHFRGAGFPARAHGAF